VAAGGFVQQHGEPQRTRLAFADAAQKEILRDAAVQDRVDKQNIAALKLAVILYRRGSGTIGEKYFTSGAAGVFDVADVFPDEVQDNGNVDGANQIGGEDERTIHGDDNIEPAATGIARNLTAKRFHASGDPSGGVCGYLVHGYSKETSLITTPLRVALPTAKSSATGKPRTHATSPPQVSTGQVAFSQRLTPNSFKRRDNLWRF